MRLSATAVVHLWPIEEFERPTATNYDHVAIVVEEIESELDAVGIEIEQALDSPLSATGEASGVYVRDPFGYRVELKARA